MPLTKIVNTWSYIFKKKEGRKIIILLNLKREINNVKCRGKVWARTVTKRVHEVTTIFIILRYNFR